MWSNINYFGELNETEMMDMSDFLMKLNVQEKKGFFLKWYIIGKKRKRVSHGENKRKNISCRETVCEWP